MDSTKAAATNATQQQRSYEDFQPSAIWIKEEENTLEVHLHDFKKEQLKVQLDYTGNLKISGERPLLQTSNVNNNNNNNKWRRFQMEFRIPKNFFINQMQAKFVGGVLYVKLPKTITRIITKQDRDQPTKTQTQTQSTSTPIIPTTNRKIPNSDYHEQNKYSEKREVVSNAAGGYTDLNSRSTRNDHKQGEDDKAKRNINLSNIINGKKDDNVMANQGEIQPKCGYKFDMGGFEVSLNRPKWMVIKWKNVTLIMVLLVCLGVYVNYNKLNSF